MQIKWAEFNGGECECVQIREGSDLRLEYGPRKSSFWWVARVMIHEPFKCVARMSVEGDAATAAEARANCEAAYPILQAMVAAGDGALQQLYRIGEGSIAD